MLFVILNTTFALKKEVHNIKCNNSINDNYNLSDLK